MNVLQFIEEDAKKSRPDYSRKWLTLGLAILIPIILGIGLRRDDLGLWSIAVWGSSFLMTICIGLYVILALSGAKSAFSTQRAILGVGVISMFALSFWRDDTSGIHSYATDFDFWRETNLCFEKGIVTGFVMSVLLHLMFAKWFAVTTGMRRIALAAISGFCGVLMLNLHCPSTHIGHILIGHWSESLVVFVLCYSFQLILFTRAMKSTLGVHANSLRNLSKLS